MPEGEVDQGGFDLNIDEALWVELEIPYGKIKEKWDIRYKANLRQHVEKNRIREHVLRIYTELNDIYDADSREAALDKLLAENEELGYNLLCLKKFSDHKKPEYFKQYRDFLDSNTVGTSLQAPYLDAWEKDDKIGLAALLQIIDEDADRLKTIYCLDYCDRKKPKSVLVNSENSDLDLTAEADCIVEQMRSNEARSYEYWHSFEYDGRQHLMIKREIDDDVELQANGNIQKEPGEFIVLRYSGADLEILSKTNTIAGRAQAGVNQAVDGVQFEEVAAQATYDEVESTIKGLLDEGPLSEIEGQGDESQPAEDDLDRLTITGIKLSSTPLPNHPSLRMKTDEGIRETIQAFQEMNYDLLEAVDDIEVIFTDFDGREYSLRPQEQERVEGEPYWIFKYDARAPPRDEREDYQALIRNLFGIDIIFEQT